MYRVLVLEDNEERHKLFKKNYTRCELVIVVEAAEAIEKLKDEEWNFLFLDHDLGGNVFVDSHSDEPTGYTVAKWLQENPERKPKIIATHSLNEAGRKNIMSVIECVDSPFAWMIPINFADVEMAETGELPDVSIENGETKDDEIR